MQAARGRAEIVVVYLHWGVEGQAARAATSRAGRPAGRGRRRRAVVGTHAHVLLGAGYLGSTYVAYGLGNYLWWRSFGNEQDDNGVLTLTFAGGSVVAAHFAAAHLDDTGVPVPAAGAQKQRIDAQWGQVRQCSGLLGRRPG